MDVEFLRYKYEDGYYGVATKQKFKIGVRHIQMVYMLATAIVLGVIRGSLGIAVLAMVDETRRNDTYIQIYDWDRRIVGAIQSSFFFGYALMIVPAEVFLRRLGGKFVHTAILLINGGLCVAMPAIVNKGGWLAVCNAHLIMGMTHACFSAVAQSLLDIWLPPNEKDLFSYFIFSGLHLGIIIGLPTSGLLTEAPLGWKLVYYSVAMLSLSMAVIYGTLTASSPGEHQAVGDAENDLIREALSTYRKKALRTPWCDILSSTSFWAVVFAHAASNALFVFFLVEAPALLNSFNISLKESALYAMFPFLSMWVVYMISDPILNWIYGIKIINCSIKEMYYRKIINTLGAVGIIIGLRLLSDLRSDSSNLVVILLTTILGILGFQLSGFLKSFKDMSENFSGTLMVLSSGIGGLIGASVPFLSGIFLEDDVDQRQWRKILTILINLYTLCNIVYGAFGSNKRQYWDNVGVRRKVQPHNGIITDNEVQMEQLSHSKLIQHSYENDMI